MIENAKLQVQAVIYKCDTAELKKTLHAMANAVRIESEKAGRLERVRFVYGDASPSPVFTDKDIEEINSGLGGIMRLEYVFFNSNTGYGRGNNLLARDSDSDYLLIMNPDIIVSPRSLIDLMQPFLDEKTGIVEARQTPIEHHKQYDIDTKETDWASGACFMIPTGLFQRLNGFDDETFFMYCEDVDLSWRVKLEGYKIIYQPLSPVFHAKRLAANAAWNPSGTEFLYSAQSNILMAYKWSNDDVLQRRLYYYKSCGIPEYKKAAEHFESLKAAGKLPMRLDPEHKVSTFNGDYYAENRFVM